MRISGGNTTICGMHPVQSRTLQVIQDALNLLCAHCGDAQAHPIKCIPEWLD